MQIFCVAFFIYLETKTNNMLFVKRSKDNQFFAGVTADNHENLQISETITTKHNAEKNLISLVKEVCETFALPAPTDEEIKSKITDLT